MRNRWVVFVLGIGTIMVLTAIGLSLVNGSMRDRTRKESYEVYSSYLNSDLEENNAGAQTLIVIQDRTQRSPADEGTGILNEFRNLLFNFITQDRVRSVAAETYRNFVLRNLWPEFLHDSDFKLAFRYKVVTTRETGLYAQQEFDRRFPENYGYFTLSSVGFNSSHTEALFYAEHQFGMAGHGNYVVMRKINGRWQTVETKHTWIS
jgi:hypothetical protein